MSLRSPSDMSTKSNNNNNKASLLIGPAMGMDIFNRINYLQTISQLIAGDDDINQLQLASFYGFTSREICLKNQVSTFGWDPIKRQTCKRCFAPLIVNQNGHDTTAVKIEKKFLIIKCLQCGTVKRIKVNSVRKTYYEKLIYGDEKDIKSKQTEMSESNQSTSKSLYVIPSK